ncbi:MAG: DUF2179 domain-containing protein [bacterium]
MLPGLDLTTLLTGFLIFLARVIDVTLGTVRTISIVYGRTKTAFFLGFIEVSMWLVVIATVVSKVASKPILGVFYALGFATGNVAGILLEKHLALGHVGLRIISPQGGTKMAEEIRKLGYAVTTFEGKGISGPVTELYIVCKRKNSKAIIQAVKSIEPDAFYTTEPTASVSKVYCSSNHEYTGWRAIFKKK